MHDGASLAREVRGHELLDFGFRLARRGPEQMLMIFGRQVVAKQQEASQVELAALDHSERDGKSLREARRGDAPARLVLAHREPSNAEVEERRARGLEIEPAFFDFAEIRE